MVAYLEFFELTSEPFENAAARPLVLETGPLRRAVSLINTEIDSRTPRLCLSGASGVGKTSLAQALPHVLDHRVARIDDPSVPWKQIEESFIEQFELAAYVINREVLLSARESSPGRLVGVVDAAERMPDETFARLEALQNNADDDGGPCVQLVFLADAESLGGPLRRVQPSYRFDPMLPRELRRYLEARMLNAGFEGDEIFPAEACHAIHHYTDGVPRRVDKLARQLLEEAARWGTTVIQPDLVARMCGGGVDTAPAWKAPRKSIGRLQRRRPTSGPSSDTDLPASRETDGVRRAEADLSAPRDPGAAKPAAGKRSAASASAPDQRAPVEERAEPQPPASAQRPAGDTAPPNTLTSWPNWVDRVNWRTGVPSYTALTCIAVVAVVTAVAVPSRERSERPPEVVATLPEPLAAQPSASAPALPTLAESLPAGREIEPDPSTRRANLDFLRSLSQEAELLGVVPTGRAMPSEPLATALASISPDAPPAQPEPAALPAAPVVKRPPTRAASVAKLAPRPSSNPQPTAAQKVAARSADRDLRLPADIRRALRGPSASSAPPAKLDLPPPSLAGFLGSDRSR